MSRSFPPRSTASFWCSVATTSLRQLRTPTPRRPGYHPSNRCRYRSEEMDRLLQRARLESARQLRGALYRRAHALFEEEMPFVPLYHASVFIARRQEVHGLIISPTGFLRFDKVWKTE